MTTVTVLFQIIGLMSSFDEYFQGSAHPEGLIFYHNYLYFLYKLTLHIHTHLKKLYLQLFYKGGVKMNV